MSEKEVIYPRQNCCFEWHSAHQLGTDNEEYGSLVGYGDELTGDHGLPEMGCGFVVHFCPFCGVKKDPVKQ